MTWKNRKNNRKRKAFTLVELLVVIGIISMLAVFTAPKLLKVVLKAKKDIAKSQIANIEGAIERFSIDCGRYPDDSEGLDALIVPPADMEEGKWNGRYLKPSQLIDPWGNPYVYIAEGEVNPGSFDLICLGADGMDGGEGDNADIINE
jgi:general secretion pathway protein G